jgi:hypothetical protein
MNRLEFFIILLCAFLTIRWGVIRISDFKASLPVVSLEKRQSNNEKSCKDFSKELTRLRKENTRWRAELLKIRGDYSDVHKHLSMREIND